MIPYTINFGTKYRDMKEVDIIYHIDDLSLDVSEYNDHISRVGIYCERKQVNFADIKFVVHTLNLRIRGGLLLGFFL